MSKTKSDDFWQFFISPTPPFAGRNNFLDLVFDPPLLFLAETVKIHPNWLPFLGCRAGNSNKVKVGGC